jgi:hypothetical protein
MMSQELHDYIRQAKEKGAHHTDIKMSLVGAGWHPTAVDDAIRQHDNMHSAPTPPASLNADMASPNGPQAPVPVVLNYSSRGVEYFLMLIALAISATALGALLHSLAGEMLNDGGTNIFMDGIMSFAGSALVVSLPIFIFFFLRLKKAELANPRLRFDASRRRAVQIALFVSFVIGIFSLISYVFTFMNSGGDSYGTDSSIGLTIADMIITIGIVGGIFGYFWMDSQQENQ